MLQRIIKLPFLLPNNIIITMKINNYKKIILVLGIFVFAFLLERIFLSAFLFEKLELMTYDLRARLSTDKGPFKGSFRHADKNIMLVSIDDYSRKEITINPQLNLGSWPWRRDVWSGVIDFIEKGKPKAILVDVAFNNFNDNRQNDIKFSNTLKKYDNVVLATYLNDSKRYVESQPETYKVVNSKYLPTPKPLDVEIDDKKIDDAITYYSHATIPDVYTQHNTMGVVNKVMDYDSVIRRAQPIFKLVKDGKTYYMPSLSFSGFLKAVGEGDKITIKNNKIHYKDRIIPINERGETNIGWHGSGHDYVYVPVSKVLLSEKNEKYVKSSDFKDKIVIIGRTEAGTDIHLSSVSPLYTGPESNATAADNFINDSNPKVKNTRKFVTKLPNSYEKWVTITICALVALMGLISKNAFLGFLNSFSLIVLYVLLSVGLYAHPQYRIWVPIMIPLYYSLITSGIVFTFKLHKEMAKRELVTNMFGKFVSPKVLSSLLKHQDELVLKNSKKEITVMFCDVKNFTALSEKSDPEELINGLNELFNCIVNIIFENNGTVDKFIGDCIMAYWGDPIASEDDAFMAVKTALDIKKALKTIQEERKKEGKILLDVKIGINSGEALLGLAGSEKIMSYTAMGDAVNTASRLESACSRLKRDILISKTTYEQIKDKIDATEIDKIKLKGKDEQIEVFEPTEIKEKKN